MAVSVSVADLGVIAINDLGRFTVTREIIFVFVAPKADDKFSELLLLALWRSYFGLESKQPSLMTASAATVLSHTTFMMWK